MEVRQQLIALKNIKLLLHAEYASTDDYQAIFSQLGQTMQLLQGFLLLHGPSRRLFSIQCNMEVSTHTLHANQ